MVNTAFQKNIDTAVSKYLSDLLKKNNVMCTRLEKVTALLGNTVSASRIRNLMHRYVSSVRMSEFIVLVQAMGVDLVEAFTEVLKAAKVPEKLSPEGVAAIKVVSSVQSSRNISKEEMNLILDMFSRSLDTD